MNHLILVHQIRVSQRDNLVLNWESSRNPALSERSSRTWRSKRNSQDLLKRYSFPRKNRELKTKSLRTHSWLSQLLRFASKLNQMLILKILNRLNPQTISLNVPKSHRNLKSAQTLRSRPRSRRLSPRVFLLDTSNKTLLFWRKNQFLKIFLVKLFLNQRFLSPKNCWIN